MTTKWQKQIAAEQKKALVADFDPGDPPKEGVENVVGVLSDKGAKALLWLAIERKKRAIELASSVMFGSSDQKTAAKDKANVLAHESSVLEGMFWQAVRTEFPEELANKTCIGLCKGWQVVWIDAEKRAEADHPLMRGLPPGLTVIEVDGSSFGGGHPLGQLFAQAMRGHGGDDGDSEDEEPDGRFPSFSHVRRKN